MYGGASAAYGSKDPAQGVASSGSPRFWMPWRRDPVLLEERSGRWTWPWAIAVTALAFVILAGGTILAGLLFAAVIGKDVFAGGEANAPLFTIGDYSGFAAIFLTYVVWLAATVIALRLRQGQWVSGMTYNVPLSWAPFWRAGGALFTVLALVGVGQYLLFPDAFTMREFRPDYAFWFALGAGVLLIQTLTEEVFFRGFLIRVWGAVIAVRLITVLLISAFFIVLHTQNPDVQADFWFAIVSFIVFEALCYWVLFRTRSVMATWGMHWINNMTAVMLVLQQPGWNSDISIFTYTDPILSAGGSYLYNPMAYLAVGGLMGFFFVLVTWRGSPFYLEKAPAVTIPPDSPVPIS